MREARHTGVLDWGTRGGWHRRCAPARLAQSSAAGDPARAHVRSFYARTHARTHARTGAHRSAQGAPTEPRTRHERNCRWHSHARRSVIALTTLFAGAMARTDKRVRKVGGTPHRRKGLATRRTPTAGGAAAGAAAAGAGAIAPTREHTRGTNVTCTHACHASEAERARSGADRPRAVHAHPHESAHHGVLRRWRRSACHTKASIPTRDTSAEGDPQVSEVSLFSCDATRNAPTGRWTHSLEGLAASGMDGISHTPHRLRYI